MTLDVGLLNAIEPNGYFVQFLKVGLTPELTRREQAAFYQTGEGDDESHAIERSG